jgi:hypothetical protein
VFLDVVRIDILDCWKYDLFGISITRVANRCAIVAETSVGCVEKGGRVVHDGRIIFEKENKTAGKRIGEVVGSG